MSEYLHRSTLQTSTHVQWSEVLHRWLSDLNPQEFDERQLSALLKALVDRGLDCSAPLPGAGETLDRWRGLALISGVDLSFGKIVEAHLDAEAVLAELAGSTGGGQRLAIWAAEPPDARLLIEETSPGKAIVDGRKSWCSGAWAVDSALVTGWNHEGRQQLALVMLDQPAVTRTRDGWAATGMAETQSVDVLFRSAAGVLIGTPRAYLDRPGFWHGGAGIAACWYGASVALAEILRARVATRNDAHSLAHLGVVDTALRAAKSVLEETARAIDRDPAGAHVGQVIRTRMTVEKAAAITLDRCGRALGATPYCRDPIFAKRAADLPVFLRQSHAERDYETLAKLLIETEDTGWAL